ncbi:Uncharacterised protein [Mycobacteroides abscessus subsp. abscessus]|nr:Uncharacterised protein [Mycobacteroides abscessus subsp. abscessus]
MTKGVKVLASMCTSASNWAPSSVRNESHSATAASHSAPLGACGRSFR